jgi:predicted dehydrogenase
MSKDKIGVIGFGSQAKRIIKILELKKKKINYIYKKTFSKSGKYNITNDLNKIYECDAIFICSPNDTHLEFIKKFQKKRYIFCEKPPVSKINQLKSLSKINTEKVYFNYNYRFSKINKSLNKVKKFKFGKLLYGNMIMCHGLATKKKYQNSWRSKKDRGVYDILAIHLIDLILNNFKVESVNKKLSKLISKNAPDNAFFSIILKKIGQVDCFTSYSSPFKQQFEFIFENGILEIRNNLVVYRGPRNTFDKKGFFINPKIILKEKFNQLQDYEQSLNDSVDFFLKTYDRRNKFNAKMNKLSLLSNKMLLKNNFKIK